MRSLLLTAAAAAALLVSLAVPAGATLPISKPVSPELSGRQLLHPACYGWGCGCIFIYYDFSVKRHYCTDYYGNFERWLNN